MTEKLHQSPNLERVDENQELLLATLASRCINVLREMEQPLHLQEIHWRAEADGLGEINISSAQARLGKMAREGVIVRIERNVYSLPEFANEAYELSKVTVRDRIGMILRQAEQPLSAKEIKSRLAEDNYASTVVVKIGGFIEPMINEGEIIRTGLGIYCLPEFANEIYSLPERTLGERIMEALWRAGRPLYRQEIHCQAETDGFGEINFSSATVALCKMVHQNLITRTELGVYSLPEFSYASERKSDSYVTKAEITGKVVNILNEVGGSSSAHYIYFLLTASNLKGLSSKQVSNLLNRMAKEDDVERKIVKTAEDAYCLTEFADEEYKEPPFKIQDRLLEILRTASRPLHLRDIHRLTEKNEQGAINLKSTGTILAALFNQGVVAKVASGVYSMPEFADKPYEIPKLSIKLRINLSLLKAAKPLHITEIRRLVNADDQTEVSLESLYSALALMVQEDTIVRVKQGVYALPECADQDYEMPKTNTRYRMMSVLREAKQPLHWQVIHRRITEDGHDAINQESTKSQIWRMVQERVIIRTSRGFYCLPEFADD